MVIPTEVGSTVEPRHPILGESHLFNVLEDSFVYFYSFLQRKPLVTKFTNKNILTKIRKHGEAQPSALDHLFVHIVHLHALFSNESATEKAWLPRRLRLRRPGCSADEGCSRLQPSLVHVASGAADGMLTTPIWLSGVIGPRLGETWRLLSPGSAMGGQLRSGITDHPPPAALC